MTYLHFYRILMPIKCRFILVILKTARKTRPVSKGISKSIIPVSKFNHSLADVAASRHNYSIKVKIVNGGSKRKTIVVL